MKFVKRMRYAAFLTIVLAGLAPAPAYADEYPPCPDGYCNVCPNGPGYYYGDFAGNCCGCDHVSLCIWNGGAFDLCYCGSAC
jgi:hypothetical protein